MSIRPSGPRNARIMLVGEAPTAHELKMGLPFTGSAGQELRRMLDKAEIRQAEIFFTYVFTTQPDKNDVKNFCASKTVVGKTYTLPPLAAGKYVLPTYLPELDRLKAEIEAVNPQLIIAVGNTACWALLRRTGISKLRGAVFPNELVPGGPPVLATYAPAAILRQWELRTICILDLIKAKRFLEEGFHPPRRELWLAPTIEECEDFCERYIFGCSVPLLSFDVETLAGTITCIGFAPSVGRALTIPFYDPTASDKNYWPTAQLEKRAYLLTKRVLQSSIPKVGQNGLYDIQYCRAWGIDVLAYEHDTMIRHHALYPELEKGLGFMGSIYTDEAPWKLLRARNKDNLKIDDE